MKLLIKIFSQTTCIILLVSSGIFLYTTYCWKNQSIQNINSYESSIFRTNILQFENKTSLSGILFLIVGKACFIFKL